MMNLNIGSGYYVDIYNRNADNHILFLLDGYLGTDADELATLLGRNGENLIELFTYETERAYAKIGNVHKNRTQAFQQAICETIYEDLDFYDFRVMVGKIDDD